MKGKPEMTPRKVLVVLALALPLCIAAQGRARGQQAAAASLSLAPLENSLTACCQAIYSPPATPPATPPLFEPTAVGCAAIGNDPTSLNSCNGVLLGCSVTAFICEPSATVANAKDCTCANLNSISPAS
jgi:hypothetical protein